MSIALTPFQFVLANISYVGILAGLCALLLLGFQLHVRTYRWLDLQPRMTTRVFGPAKRFAPAGAVIAGFLFFVALAGRGTTWSAWASFVLFLSWILLTISVLGALGWWMTARVDISNHVPLWDIRSASEPERSPNLEARRRYAAWWNLRSCALFFFAIVPVFVLKLPNDAVGLLVFPVLVCIGVAFFSLRTLAGWRDQRRGVSV